MGVIIVKTITLQVHDKSEVPSSHGWYYVLFVRGGQLLAVDWLRWDGKHWHEDPARWQPDGEPIVDLPFDYWFDLGPIMESSV